MRSGLTTIQQTLTPEAASVLTQSIAEAGRRNHSQTTPLHVASTLLAAPTGFLRQACIRSHPNSSHPLQCRALELCFSVALDRLPAATSSTEPPISNALMAALKRAQAHQRRGCPEQQQQPLLAVKVELEQLIISILDDPSVSRVMREASFSSPNVKLTIEQSLSNTSSLTPVTGGIGFRPSPSPATIPVNRNLYLNPRLQQNETTSVSSSVSRNLYLNPRLQQGSLNLNLQNSSSNQSAERCDDVKRVVGVMTNSCRRNPILVGESEPEAIRREILLRIRKDEFGFKNVEFFSIEKELVSVSDKLMIPAKIKQLGDRIEGFVGDNRSVLIDLGDLKWLVEQLPASIGRESVAEMAKIIAKFEGKVWLIGTATCDTYLRCQVYHPSMEANWALQAMPIATKSPLPSMFPRIGTNGVLGGKIESLNATRRPPYCSKCSNDYEQELAQLNELAQLESDEVKSSLPQWLQNTQVKDGEPVSRDRIQELQKKWSDTCSRIHPNSNRSPIPMVVPSTGMYKPNMLLRQAQPAQLQPKPTSPVRTELALGPKNVPETIVTEDLTVKDLLGCISSEPQGKVREFQKGKFVNSAEADSFKKLLKGLMKKAWWQPEAASAIATTITQCKVETGSRGCVWLLFAGPDRVGKRKMASALAEHVCGSNPITIGLGPVRADDEEPDTGFRGKTVLDRIVEAVRRNPFSVLVLSDVDEAETLIRASIKRAMERGRIADSYGREISLGNVVFVLTGNWSTVNVNDCLAEERRLRAVASGDWRLRLVVGGRRLKRRADWLVEKSRKPRKEPGLDLSLDLNLAVDADEDQDQDQDQDQDRADGSINSSILTIDQEDGHEFAVTSVPHELVGPSDGAVVFKPVNFGFIRREIEKTVKNAFSKIVDEKVPIEVEEGAVENLLGGLWFGRTGLEEWAEQVLVPSFERVKAGLGGDVAVRLESDRDSGAVGGGGDWLPSKISLVVEGVGN